MDYCPIHIMYFWEVPQWVYLKIQLFAIWNGFLVTELIVKYEEILNINGINFYIVFS